LRPYLEKTHHKKGLVEWLKGPEFKPQYQKKKENLHMSTKKPCPRNVHGSFIHKAQN
jgi:hypothetical protein